MERKYPVIDMVRTGQNLKRIMRLNGMNVKDIQGFLELSTPQSIYHWFDGRNLPTIDNLYALSELFHLPVDDLIIGN
jgi:transcriptional regulator with XRE-family HTH domain